MKAFILAGGLGTRLGEITENVPKPMVMIDENPIIWHVMRILQSGSVNEIDCLLGYKGDVIRRYLLSLSNYGLDFKVKLDGSMPEYKIQQSRRRLDQNLVVGCTETGLQSYTARRIKIALESCDDEDVVVTYGDGLGNIDMKSLLSFHASHGKLVTVTAVRPIARFGHLNIVNKQVIDFEEKSQIKEGWINGGFMVLNRAVLSYLNQDEPFEGEPLKRIANEGQLMAFEHSGFWHPMDTPNDLLKLRQLAESSLPAWLDFSKNA